MTTRWSLSVAEPEEDDDGPLYDGMITDPDGVWVHREDIAELEQTVEDLNKQSARDFALAEEWKRLYEAELSDHRLLKENMAGNKEQAEANFTDAITLISRWLNFDFDCPEEEDDDEDGEALNRLYADTGEFLATRRKLGAL